MKYVFSEVCYIFRLCGLSAYSPVSVLLENYTRFSSAMFKDAGDIVVRSLIFPQLLCIQSAEKRVVFGGE